jgi:hypothetical protein
VLSYTFELLDFRVLHFKWLLTGSMALMDAGIPVREHVAGLSVGLISQVDPTTGNISDYLILTDILVSVMIHTFSRTF